MTKAEWRFIAGFCVIVLGGGLAYGYLAYRFAVLVGADVP